MGIPRNDFADEGRSILDDADEAYENLRAYREESPAVLTQEHQAHLDRLDCEDAAFSIALLRGAA